jgi:hypothetical protein
MGNTEQWKICCCNSMGERRAILDRTDTTDRNSGGAYKETGNLEESKRR